MLKKILPPTPDSPPVCLKGARACPPEDCGGAWGDKELADALADRAHERHEDLVDWIGEFDAQKFDLAEINEQLAMLHAHWRNRRRRLLRFVRRGSGRESRMSARRSITIRWLIFPRQTGGEGSVERISE